MRWQLAKGGQWGWRHGIGRRCKCALKKVDWVVVMLRLRRWLCPIVWLLDLRVKWLPLVSRNIEVAPSDATSCCTRVVGSLLPEKENCTGKVLVEFFLRKCSFRNEFLITCRMDLRVAHTIHCSP